MLFGLLILEEVVHKRKIRTTLFFWIAWIVMFFLHAMRSEDVGKDTAVYNVIFARLASFPWSKILTGTITYWDGTGSIVVESGYKLYNKIVSCLLHGPNAIIVANAFLLMILLYIVIKKESPNSLLSLYLYFTLGYYQSSMNTIRNAIAVLIVYIGISSLEKKQVVKYFLYVLLATTFHSSSILFFLMYFVFKFPIEEKNVKVYFRISVLAFAGISFILPQIKGLVPAKYQGYITATKIGTESIILGAVFIILFFFVFLSMKRKERTTVVERHQNGIWLELMNFSMYAMGIRLSQAARLAALFGVWQIVFIPQMLQTIESKKRRQIITGMVVVGMAGVYILRVMINNIGSTIPYEFSQFYRIIGG